MTKDVWCLTRFLLAITGMWLASCSEEQPRQTATSAPKYEYKVVTSWGGKGSNPGKLDGPQGLAVDDQGRVYVTDAENCRIVVFSSTGEYVRAWGSCGNSQGEFLKPVDVAVGPQGYVYVVDFHLDRVQVFGPDGQFKFGWGKPGMKAGEFSSPVGIAASRRERI